MAADPKTFDSSVLDLMACPACLGELRVEEAHLRCAKCNRTYPIVDGIAVLVDGREEAPA
jgi:uncharacterized protein YbaR (Trm112 family)